MTEESAHKKIQHRLLKKITALREENAALKLRAETVQTREVAVQTCIEFTPAEIKRSPSASF